MASTSLRNRIASGLVNLGKLFKRNDFYFDDHTIYNLHPKVDEILSLDAVETYMRAYHSISSVFDGVSTIAMNAAEVPLKVWRRTATGRLEECHDHPIMVLLGNPNKLLTRFQLFEATYAYMLLTGNAYWFLEFPDHLDAVAQRLIGEEPFRIHVERPDLVEVDSPNHTENLIIKRHLGQSNRSNNAVQEFAPNEVVHFKLFNPLSLKSGLPPIAAGQNTLVLELYLDVFGKGFYKNAVVPSTVFTTDGNTSRVAFERFKAVMQREYQGVSKAHQMLLLSGNVKPVDMRVNSPQDSDYHTTQELTRSRIYTTLGCYHLVAIANGVSGEGIKEAYKMYWNDTVNPRLTTFSETVNKYLMPKWNGSYPNNEECFVKHDVRNVPGMREDFSELTTGLFRGIQAGYLGKKEAREIYGLNREMEADDETGLGHEPSVGRFDPNEIREITEDMTNPNRLQTTSQNGSHRNGNKSMTSLDEQLLLGDDITLSSLQDEIREKNNS